MGLFMAKGTGVLDLCAIVGVSFTVAFAISILSVVWMGHIFARLAKRGYFRWYWQLVGDSERRRPPEAELGATTALRTIAGVKSEFGVVDEMTRIILNADRRVFQFILDRKKCSPTRVCKHAARVLGDEKSPLHTEAFAHGGVVQILARGGSGKFEVFSKRHPHMPKFNILSLRWTPAAHGGGGARKA